MELETLVVVRDQSDESRLVEKFIRENLIDEYVVTYCPATYTPVGCYAPLVYLLANSNSYYYGNNLWPFLESLKKQASKQRLIILIKNDSKSDDVKNFINNYLVPHYDVAYFKAQDEDPAPVVKMENSSRKFSGGEMWQYLNTLKDNIGQEPGTPYIEIDLIG